MGREIDAGVAMSIEDMLDIFLAEEIVFDESAIQELFSRVVLEFITKPVCYRDTEAHLRTEHDFIGNDATKRFFQDILFVIEAFDFQAEWNLRGKLEKFMIEKRRPSFEGDCHAGDVDFYQEVIGEIGGEVCVDCLLRSIIRSGSIELACDEVIGIILPNFLFEFIGIEPLLLRIGEV